MNLKTMSSRRLFQLLDLFLGEPSLTFVLPLVMNR
ncbi:hypothetical protein Goari_009894 [Gossypium aridum]|uniref:Uncharacterized protein n=1 Tax=Gossypium aridum TaxID=34290 RepID=A0A7J8XYE7_GOSAI|nr:hypothetical protein [Gossypium aridum]